jgi:membrane protein implicated in regulation of membrane protease activity
MMAIDETFDAIIAECDEYWAQTRVPDEIRASLRSELRAKLDAATRRGRSPRRVTGRNLTLFAESMASRHRLPPPSHPPISPSDRTLQRWVDFIPAYGWLLPVVAAAVLLMIFGPKEDAVEDPNLWRWLWLGIAVVLGIGEMLTAGFFMLPFAIGAAIAALLAWAQVALVVQLVVFITVSLFAVVALRRFAWGDREPSYPVGVKRFVGARGVVIEVIDERTGGGRVRLGKGELWSASTDLGTVIHPGTPVKVVEVRGTHLVVEPVGGDL